MNQQDQDRDSNQAEAGVTQAGSRGRRGRSWLAIVAIVGIVIVAAVAAFVYKATGVGFSIELTEKQLQEVIDSQFPMEKKYLVALTITLSEPRVKLSAGSDRIALGMKANLSAGMLGQGRQYHGSGTVTTGLQYEPQSYTFFLNDPLLTELVVEGAPVEHLDRANTLAAELIRERLNRVPVYTLKSDDMKQQAAKLVLKEMTVRGGKVVIRLGL